MVKIKNLFVVLVIVPFLIGIGSCTHKPTYTVCFKTEVLPIFQSNCAMSGCHDATTAEHDIVLDSYENIMKEIEPGKPSSSKIYESIVGSGEDAMPPNKPLSSQNVAIIKAWIEQGADTLCK